MGRANDAAAQLVGTCEGAPDMDDWTKEELLEFDSLVFECEGCGWWYDVGEMEGDQKCSDCADLEREGEEEE